MSIVALSDPRSPSQGVPAETAEAAGKAVECRYCGEPNGIDREGCLQCGGLLRPASDDGAGAMSPPSDVWLSPHLLDVGARAELARMLRLGPSSLEGGTTAR